jgi:DME family drug/metabolite transporter
MVAIGSAPIIAGLLDWFVQGERPSPKWVGATILAITGAVFLSGLGQNSQTNMDWIGLLLAVGTGASYALYALASKQLLQTHKPDAVMAVLFMLGAILLLPFLFTVDLNWLLVPQGLLVALHLGVIATAVSYILFARGLVTVGVATAVTLSLAEPLTAATLGIFLLGEPITPTIAIGMALIFAGLALLSVRR